MSDKSFFIGAVVLVVGIIVFATIYNNGGGQANISGATQVQDRDKAPDFSLKELNGETITLSQYRGEKPVILDFFATWCPNCQRDMPKLSKWYEKYSSQVEVIGINLQESEGKVKSFIDSRGISFPIVLDPGSKTASAYGVRYTNLHVLIDKDGNIVREIPGDIKESDIKALAEDSAN